MRLSRELGLGLALGLAAIVLVAGRQALADDDPVTRGEYLVHAGGCVSCHTPPGGTPFAGGRALATPFGTFYSPNITPDRDTGIGRWSDADFVRALRKGDRPDGSKYFPVFPYPSFTGIAAEDALAIKAYLFSLPSVPRPNRAHDVSFPFSWRFLQNGWRLLFFERGRFSPIRSAAKPIIAAPIWSRRSLIAANATRRAISSARSKREARFREHRTAPMDKPSPTSPPTPRPASAIGRKTTSSSC